jgi:hypothetical protein
MKAPPHELAELDNLYGGRDDDLLNLALPYGERVEAVAGAGAAPLAAVSASHLLPSRGLCTAADRIFA